jgi:SAM-dependent methyltransferase
VKTGAPTQEQPADVPENPFWEKLVPAIAVLAAPSAEAVARKLRLAEAGEIETLDIGGGSGIYSAVFLTASPKARALQLDWANVNRIAKGFVARFGVGDRFETEDGDFHTADLGDARWDVVVYSNIAHQETPESNRDVFARVRRALKPGGTLVVSDFVAEDDRSGPPFALLFASIMLMATREGRTYARREYRDWLEGAGFRSVEIEPTGGPSTLIYAS